MRTHAQPVSRRPFSMCSIAAIGVSTTAAFVLATAHAGDLESEFGDCEPCIGDFNSDGAVDGADLGALLQSWGACADCDTDLNGDGIVDGADLGMLLKEWGDCPQFNYPAPAADGESYQIALEMLGAGGPLLPPDDLVERVARDIALIREFEPELVGKFHTPLFQSDFLILSRDDTVDPSSYLCLNDYYQASIWAELEALQMTIIQFPGPINTPALAPIYEASPHVIWADPSAIYGGENFWFPTPFGGVDGVWFWFVDDGFHDCFDGCDCHYYYEFSITGDGTVTLINAWTAGHSWCPWPF